MQILLWILWILWNNSMFKNKVPWCGDRALSRCHSSTGRGTQDMYKNHKRCLKAEDDMQTSLISQTISLSKIWDFFLFLF